MHSVRRNYLVLLKESLVRRFSLPAPHGNTTGAAACTHPHAHPCARTHKCAHAGGARMQALPGPLPERTLHSELAKLRSGWLVSTPLLLMRDQVTRGRRLAAQQFASCCCRVSGSRAEKTPAMLHLGSRVVLPASAAAAAMSSAFCRDVIH